MDNFAESVRPHTNQTDRRGFGLAVEVCNPVGTSAALSDDVINNLDVTDPGNATVPTGAFRSQVLGHRTLGFHFQGMNPTGRVRVTVQGPNQFNVAGADECILTAANPCFVTKNAYIGYPTILLEPLDLESGAFIDVCSVGFGSPIPFEGTPDGSKGQQVLYFDSACRTYTVDAVTWDPSFQTFTPDNTPSAGDRFIINGCSDCTDAVIGGSTTISDPVASF